jgi:Lon protease-like protein
MTKFIPIFPLNIVVYPGENLNLHIFEPRYIQLIKDCITENKPFGIPSVLQSGILELGTTVKILSIENEKENGEMDIKTVGESVFRILETVDDIPNKLYKGAIVNFPHNNEIVSNSKMKIILNELRLFHELIEIEKKYKKTDTELCSYDIAHHIGLSLHEEYTLLTLFNEEQRQEFVFNQLKKIIQTTIELKNLKERILLNGHFRKLSVNE